mmetsp:Transcript_31828/g.42429  ORF Transcript_31828/g.42429 Transcript_31828/m.42429 type:complete len:329 (+) Transcript_31828:752-1738(+)
MVWNFLDDNQAAIIKLHGFILNGRPMRVEPITDKPGINRVRVPEKIVAYTVGTIKKTRGGQLNKMRRNTHEGKHKRLSREDIEKLNLGRNSRRKNRDSQVSISSLNKKEVKSFERAMQQGFVTLEGTGYRRGRKGSALASLHRQWCDDRGKPHIVYCKASGGRALDNIIVDLSPLRMGALSPDKKIIDEFLSKWKIDILMAAENSGMILNESYEEDNTERLDTEINEDEEEERPNSTFTITIDPDTWSNNVINALPSVSMGVFEGERSQAKTMARALSDLWEVPDEEKIIEFFGDECSSNNKKRKNDDRKRKGLKEHRRNKRFSKNGW